MRHLLRWLLNALARLFSKNPLVKGSIRVVVLFWSTFSLGSSCWPRGHTYSPPSEEQRPQAERDNTSLNVGNSLIPLSNFGLDLSQAAFLDLPQVHVPSATHDTFYGSEVTSPQKRAHFDHPTIRPVFPECIARYNRNVVIPWEDTKYIIPPLTVTFQMCENPPGWTLHHHPEGARYFYHEQKKVYTEADIYDDALCARIHSTLDEMDVFLQVHNIQRSPRDDIVLELTKNDDGEIETSYYFANHENRVIYFLDEYDACNLPVWSEVQGVTSPSHIKHEIEVQYWYGCFKSRTSPHLIYEIPDLILSPTSTAPYKVEDMQKILDLMDSLTHNVGTEFKGSTCTLSSLMYIFVRQRFLNFHGQPGARLNRDQSIHGKATSKRSWLILLLSPVFFYAPEVHLRVLEKLGIDGLLHDAVWDQFINSLRTEWQEFTLYATVLLNANVAFLAIQSVDIDQGNYRSPAQIFSYTSTMSSIGGIILGLSLVRQNRNKAGDNTYGYFVFTGKQGSFVRRLEVISIFFSLPYTLLMWGTVHFLAAFLSMCFQNSSTSAQSFVGAILVLIAILIVWCIWMAWETTPQEVSSKYEAARPFKKFWRSWIYLVSRRLPGATRVTDV